MFFIRLSLHVRKLVALFRRPILHCFAVLTLASESSAQLVTLDFTGRVNQITEGGSPTFPQVGDLVSGSITYDLATPDTDPRFDTGLYNQMIPNGFDISVGSLDLAMGDYHINVYNRIPGEGPWDAMSFRATTGPLFGSNASTFVGFGFQENDNVLSSTELPAEFDLADLPLVDAAGVLFDTNDIWRIDFTLLSLANRPIPEPATAVLALAALALAACGLFGMHRRRETSR